jgi:co-chaperonin GroES (HSP10)
MNILPLQGQCLVEILPRDDAEFGSIVIPEGVDVRVKGGKLPPERGIVRRLGRWPQKKGGLCAMPEFTPGDTVLLSRYSGQKLKQLGDRFRLVKVSDVLAVLHETTFPVD